MPYVKNLESHLQEFEFNAADNVVLWKFLN